MSKDPEFGLNNLPGTARWVMSPWVSYMNKLLAKLRSPVDIKKRFNHREDMVSLEQIGNFELLITDLIDRDVQGDFVELGCYSGSTSAVFGSLLHRLAPERRFLVYDRFDMELGSTRNIRSQFEQRMKDCGLPMPIVHEGDLFALLPAQLPASIAFAHIDLGTGGGVYQHAELLVHSLKHVYPRLSSGAILILMDYHVPDVTIHGNDSNPAVRLVADTFFEDKPEKMRVLYGGPCSHAYIRKN
ncbi:MAG: class I SAM-dependent methyltransferase [Flavobacteriales bacterium]|nr:class I SAM-dependent methyltransferase [Flavobacteriales bacterium]MBK9195595.1 class I SAM-dependent methyltransferase [Flavobacteriales bacterium]